LPLVGSNVIVVSERPVYVAAVVFHGGESFIDDKKKDDGAYRCYGGGHCFVDPSRKAAGFPTALVVS